MTSAPSSPTAPTPGSGVQGSGVQGSGVPGIGRVLIANRGEIALRVARTCARLGIEAVMIRTDLDAGAPHTRAELVERVASYLDVDAVLDAVHRSGADAVHPGYGFLSENPDLARAVIDAGITWVGPPVAAMTAMARKDAAREIAVAAGVPVVPAYDATADPTTFAYPVLVKAAAGGGGKGMRVVRSAGEYAEALAAARREATSAFGDDTMLVERFVERGRHLEVQVLGDVHGTVLHLGERDCSPQRRHQKVLEEAPAPTLDEPTRERIRRSGVALAAQVGYVNAGTVEFLLDSDTGDFFFLEMNTRLQVEHPVTEAVTGLDLVELQLRVAAGQPLPITQDDVRLRGHAIEARIYAEDAYGGFLPQAGTVSHVVWPHPGVGEGVGGGEGEVRVDHALADGQHVSTAYDPMLAKVVAHGADREAARAALIAALDQTAVLGLTTNAGFLRALVASEGFRDAAIDTAWLDRNPLPVPDDAPARAAAGVLLHAVLREAPRGPWQPDGFRAGGPPGPLVEHGRDLSWTGWTAPPRATTGLQRIGLLTAAADPDPVTGVAGVEAFVLRGRHGTEVVVRGQRFVLAEPETGVGSADAGDGVLTAPMPGTVLDVRVEAGEEVREGRVLGVLEAMKMELSLTAPFDGVVTSVGAAAGRQVALGTPLFVVEPRRVGSPADE